MKKLLLGVGFLVVALVLGLSMQPNVGIVRAVSACPAPGVSFTNNGFGFGVDGPCALSHYTPTYCDGTVGEKIEDGALVSQDTDTDEDDFATVLGKEIKSILWKAGTHEGTESRECSNQETSKGSSMRYEAKTCGETTFYGKKEGKHSTDNMYLVVESKGSIQKVNIPVNGDLAQITVGPFTTNETISYRLFGGGERDYDLPLWNGHGGGTFKADINTYGGTNGWGWLLAGTTDPNPFVTWYELEVEGCPEEQPEQPEQPKEEPKQSFSRPAPAKAPSCPDTSPVKEPANPHIYRNGDVAVVKWYPTEGNNAHIYYKEGTSSTWQHAVRDIANSGYFEISGLGNGDWDFAVQQANGCAAGPMSPVIIDGPAMGKLFLPTLGLYID